MIPTGPVKQYADEPVEANETLTVYPGADGTSTLYDDDGRSFDYRAGAWMRIAMEWRDAARRLTLRLAPGSRMPTSSRRFDVRLNGSAATREVVFDGAPVDVQL